MTILTLLNTLNVRKLCLIFDYFQMDSWIMNGFRIGVVDDENVNKLFIHAIKIFLILRFG